MFIRDLEDMYVSIKLCQHKDLAHVFAGVAIDIRSVKMVQTFYGDTIDLILTQSCSSR